MSTNNPFPSRLRQARLLAKLSLRELSEKSGSIVSYNSIKKYEDGKMMPDESVITGLAQALNVGPDYFFKAMNVELSKVEFRKRANLSVKDLNSIKEQIRSHLERYLEIENILRIENNFYNPISDMLVQDTESVENIVLHLLREWHLGYNPIPNVIEMLEEKGVKIIEIDAPEAFDGLAAFADHTPVIVLNKNFLPERKRFTALHELGHILLKIPRQLDSKVVESICHRFASAMLIPKPVMINLIGFKRSTITIAELITIKENYGISLQAIVRRCKDLSIITEYAYKAFFISISKNRKEEGLGKYKGQERTFRFTQLLYRIAAEELVTIGKAAALGEMKTIELKRILDRIL
ncbi:helix-turn-helix domain-containing protein [Arsenicibacter rosenii]|uniref:HTH cro/C1-type domain-containing protein n=1 Tax=Arsenicibacter rosenii TaxID=1750698 RepID=A0A1S2VHF8_9BACT|nr:XRE family transcriptional regulator [Arsenicibacter rosenii]OIN57646.1 hypothetical protein BLX24_19245 [Arsenicibacter rosenii]